MSKAIKVTAIVSVIIQVVFFIAGRFLVPFGMLFLNNPNIMHNATQGIFYYILYSFFAGIVLVFAYVIFMVLLIHSSNGNSENITTEVVGIVLLAGVIPLVSSLSSVLVIYIFNLIGSRSSEDYGVISLLNSYSGFTSLVITGGNVLMIISMTISLCRKKFVIPLEYEKGYGVSDEFTGGEPNMGYMQSDQNRNNV